MTSQSKRGARRRPGIGRALWPALALGLAAGVAGCGGGGEPERSAEVEILGTNPTPGATTSAPAAPAAQPGAGGIVDYGSYQTVIARQGDSVSDLAARAGLSASALAAYNGLTPSHGLQAGDELVLPPRPEGYTATATPQMAGAPSDSVTTAPLPGAGTPAASGEQWSPSLAAAAIENSAARSAGQAPSGALGAPPSAGEPLPPEPPARQALRSPDLGQYQTGAVGSPLPPPAATAGVAETAALQPAAEGGRLVRPVQGTVAVGYNQSPGGERNNGVDFAAAAGSPVLAAADGTVALVSDSLGDLGTIVLLRHADDLLTVYGRIDGVTVQKGDTVRAGQEIGVVAAAASPNESLMHFEVRRGAESLDPMRFL